MGSGGTPQTPPALGRSATIDGILALLRARQDVVVDGEVGLGQESLRAALATAAENDGWRVVAPDGLAGAPLTTRVLLLADLDEIEGSHLRDLTALRLRTPTRFVLTRRPLQPFAAATRHDSNPAIAGAVRVDIRPLTLSESDQLVDEQLARGALPRDVSGVERRWVWVTSGGFPRIALSLLHDLMHADETPVGPVALSRATVVEASAVISALPSVLRELAESLLPLIGVGVTRLQHSFDQAELSLLFESFVVRRHEDALRIPAPIQAALRLHAGGTRIGARAREVLVDICTAIAVDAGCSESEVAVAAAAIIADPELRALLTDETQRSVMSAGMWAARRRGDTTAAAALARRLMTVFPDQESEVLRVAARGARDDFAGYAREVAADDFAGVPPPGLWAWVMSMRFPMTGAADGLLDLLGAVRDRLPSDEARRLDALVVAIRSVAALEAGDVGTAVSLAAQICGGADTDVFAQFRALAVRAAVASIRLNHAELSRVDAEFVALLRRRDQVPGLTDAFARRTAANAALVIALAFTGAGLQRSAEARAFEDTWLTEAMIVGDATRLLPPLVTRLLSAVHDGDSRELQTVTAFIRRHGASELGVQVLAILDRDPHAPLERARMSRFMRFAVSAMRAIGVGLRATMGEFAESLRAIEEQRSPLLRLGLDFVAAASGVAVAATGPALDAEIEEHTVPGALAGYLAGVAAADPTPVLRAAAVFIEAGAAQPAASALEAALLLTGDDAELSEEIRAMRQTLGAASDAAEHSPQALTARERQVALLAAQGMRNRDIARRLYLSVRTVESHLYRAKRKLLIPRESLQLATLLQEPGPPTDAADPEGGPEPVPEA